MLLVCSVRGIHTRNDIAAQELSAVATASKFPVTVARAFNVRVVNDEYSPFSAQVFPDLFAQSNQLVDFLLHQQRDDFIATIYVLSLTGVQRSESLSLSYQGANMNHELFSYGTPGKEETLQTKVVQDDQSIRAALFMVKESGYRTIVIAMEVVTTELPLIADAAEEFGLNNGDYFWIIYGNADPVMFTLGTENVKKLLAGAAWSTPIHPHFFDESSRFLQAWRRSNATDVDRANAANPIEPGEHGYFFAGPEYFQSYFPDYGDGFVFYAVMSTGIGACLASVGGGNVTSEAHAKNIRKVDFTGASGRVKFGADRGKEGEGGRDPATVTWGIVNVFPPVEPFVQFTLADIYINGTWTALTDFVYGDGRTEPPALLRDVPEQNYLNSGIRAF